MKVSTMFEVDTTIHCLAISLLLLIRYVTLWPWHLAFWPWPVVIRGGSRTHVVNLATKFEDPTAICSWVLISPIGYRWQCVCSHCACAVSRDLCVGGKCFPPIWNPWPRFAYSLYNFYGATMTFKGRLLLALLMLKLVSGLIISKYRSDRTQKWRFGVERGVDVKFWFCDPQKAHPCAEPRLLTYFASVRRCPWWRLGCIGDG